MTPPPPPRTRRRGGKTRGTHADQHAEEDADQRRVHRLLHQVLGRRPKRRGREDDADASSSPGRAAALPSVTSRQELIPDGPQRRRPPDEIQGDEPRHLIGVGRAQNFGEKHERERERVSEGATRDPDLRHRIRARRFAIAPSFHLTPPECSRRSASPRGPRGGGDVGGDVAGALRRRRDGMPRSGDPSGNRTRRRGERGAHGTANDHLRHRAEGASRVRA